MSNQKVEINVSGTQKLRGLLCLPDSAANPTGLLFIHGWTGSPNTRAAEFMAARGYPSLAFSMRGHGESDGELAEVTRQQSLADAVAAYDFLHLQLPDNGRIVAIGNSYGSYIALVLSKERPVAALSLRVPAGYPDAGFDEPQLGKGHNDIEVMKWRKMPQVHKGNKGFEAIHNFAGPIQIIEAELDDLIPHQTVQNYMNAVSNPSKLEHHLMKGWTHSIGNNQQIADEFQKILINWLSNL